MEIKIIASNEDTEAAWDRFATGQPNACLYHAFAWHDVIQTSYGHPTYYLAAFSDNAKPDSDAYKEMAFPERQVVPSTDYSRFVGLLPLVQIKSWLFGNSITSIPFFDSGGLLVSDQVAEKSLLLNTLKLAEKLKATSIDIRQNYQLGEFVDDEKNHLEGWKLSLLTNKVRMVISLPETPELLMKSFPAKLRSQIRKPIKEGLSVKIGGTELVNDFYTVFLENMRDLGSPVHSKKFIIETLKAFKQTANLFVVYHDQAPLAGSMTIGFKDTLANPWASSLRRYSPLAPNMLLYWSMLEYACQQGYQFFDFGRSTPGEGTYKFKEQWGAKAAPLYWYRLSKANEQSLGGQPNKDKMSKVIEYWKKLPVPLTQVIGPRVRKYISL